MACLLSIANDALLLAVTLYQSMCKFRKSVSSYHVLLLRKLDTMHSSATFCFRHWWSFFPVRHKWLDAPLLVEISWESYIPDGHPKVAFLSWVRKDA